MRLYFFNPNTYGDEYSVMSSSPEEAIDSVKQYLKDVALDPENIKYEFYWNDYKKWEGATIDNLPDSYSLEVFEANHVIHTYNG